MQARAPVVVGRSAEIEQIDRVLSRARRSRGSAVFLTGERGVGKSRLAGVAAAHAADLGMRVLRGRGSTIGPAVPFRPLTEALTALFRGGAPGAVGELAPYKSVLGRLIPDWSSGRPPPEGESVVVMAEGVLRLLATVGRQQPCLLVLDDLQHADAGTLAVIEYLADNLDRQPVVLLAPVRSEPGRALSLVRLVSGRAVGVHLDVGRLSQDGVLELAAALLEVEPAGVPGEVVERLWLDSAGNPLVVEKLLSGMVRRGLLVAGPAGCQVPGSLRAEVPAELVRCIARHVEQLSARDRELLSVAAVHGWRFSLPVVQRAAGVGERSMRSHLRERAVAQLVTADEPVPEWYAFRHPLLAAALRAGLPPADRADLARRTADAIHQEHPGLPAEWCGLAASLRLDAGETARGCSLLAEAGRRLQHGEGGGSAGALLDRAEKALGPDVDPALRAEVLESLLPALGEAGQSDRAFQLLPTVTELGSAGLDRERQARLHTCLARVAYLAGDWSCGFTEVRHARALLGSSASTEQTAPVDAVAAFLTMHAAGANRVRLAAELARTAAEVGTRVPLPVVGCEAWQLLGSLSRSQDLTESDSCFERARTLAEEHDLPLQETYALVGLAGNEWLRSGSVAALGVAESKALRIGAIVLARRVSAVLALHAVLLGVGDGPGRLVLHGSPADRRDLPLQARQPLATPSARGLVSVIHALLAENQELARSELARMTVHDEDPASLLANRHGLRLLLDVLAGRSAWSQHVESSAAAAGGMRWNHIFVQLAGAVLLGRDGQHQRASKAVRAAEDAADAFPLARHLGLRLVAESAHADGWGDPVAWLREAEEYFHQAQVSAVAGACRSLLRKVGATVRQRRSGIERVPARLRALGVTAREFEVLGMLAGRMGNKVIAGHLHISPRTVEKHVASLRNKVNLPNREALIRSAGDLTGPA